MILATCTRLPDHRWALHSPYNRAFVEMARAIPGMRWNGPVGAWVGYGDAVTLLARGLVAAKVAKVTGSLPPAVETLSGRCAATADPRLRPYQAVGVDFVRQVSREGALLTDGTGMGKTRTALIAIEKLPLPAVIVCPANLKRTWQREGQKIGLDPLLLFGTRPPADGHIHKSDGIVVVNYDIVGAWLPYLKGAATVAFDEVHALTNASSKRSVACKELAHAARHRIGLSATPMQNRPRELWNVVDTLSPGRFGHFFIHPGRNKPTSYVARYCDAHQESIDIRPKEEREDDDSPPPAECTKLVWNFNGSSHVDELHERLRYFKLGRTKAEVKLELPAMQRQTIELDVPREAIENDWNLENKSAARMALMLAAQAKIPFAVDLAIEKHAEGSSVVIWAYEKRIARAIVQQLRAVRHDAFLATGDDTEKQRDMTIQRARAARPSILVATTRAMGTGIDLSFADVSIAVELDYVPGGLVQGEGRLDRPGQTNPVLCLYLVALGTIDEVIRDRIVGKLQVIDATVGAADKSFCADLKLDEDDAFAALRESLRELGEEYARIT